MRRLGYYFVFGSIIFDQKKVTLFTDLARLRDVDDLTFDEAVLLAQEHFNKKPSTIIRRFRFYKCDHKCGDSLADYVADLRTLSEYCEFHDIEDQLHDRRVCGTFNNKLQKDMQEAQNLDFTKALKMSQAVEVAAKSCKARYNIRSAYGSAAVQTAAP